MSYFIPPSYIAMDRASYEGEAGEEPKLEEPIFPISRLGVTVPEVDPTGRIKNLVQGIQANIRHGAGTMQVMMTVSPEQPLGGRAKAYGEEVREAIREIAKANEVMIKGFEISASSPGMSGFDPQHMQFSDDRRQMQMQEVKDVIKFAAETAGGGSVDVVSFEFPRAINDGQWKDADKFEKPGEQRIGWLVDKRTGRITQFRKDEEQVLPVIDEKGEIQVYTEEEAKKEGKKAGEIKTETWTWEKFEKRAREEGKGRNPEEIYIDKQLEAQKATLMGWYSSYKYEAEKHKESAEMLQKDLEEMKKRGRIPPEKIKEREQRIREQLDIYQDRLRAASGNLTQAMDLEERKKALVPMDRFAIERSVQGYAELGVNAMQTTQNNKYAKSDLYVGPEIGWPEQYGGHPEEFKQLIEKSRQQMIRLLTDPRKTNTEGKYIDEKGNVVEDPSRAAENAYYQGIDRKRAQEYADRHIKGVFDTSHMGMWLAHFKPEKGESEDSRIDRFNKWYLDKVREIARSGIVGGIQLVDSASAAHGHLPPGQGIFPVKDAAKIFKDEGYTGFLVSEGHEEEKFNEGRIMTKTWELLGAKPGAGYFQGGARPWGQVSQSYFGKTYSPMFMFGSYAPSNEFKLWSEVPLE